MLFLRFFDRFTDDLLKFFPCFGSFGRKLLSKSSQIVESSDFDDNSEPDESVDVVENVADDDVVSTVDDVDVVETVAC